MLHQLDDHESLDYVVQNPLWEADQCNRQKGQEEGLGLFAKWCVCVSEGSRRREAEMMASMPGMEASVFQC